MTRVRFAPSPTGLLHVGNARTALFNWLFARKHNGKFILRIEDTDLERSQEQYVEQIMVDLRWLGIAWDEGPDVGGSFGPYRQSERLGIYQEHLTRLVKEGKAYQCYCTPEELEAKRQAALAHGQAPRYDNRCRALTDDERRRFEEAGLKPVVRLRIPDEGAITFHDLVRGDVTFAVDDLGGDFVIVKSDGRPLFHFSVVVDDHLMQVSHVIRGEDHLSNTPKHLLLYKALSWTPPQHAHMSLTLSPEGGRLSKREFSTAIAHYREAGYLPEAIVNYLALLGWSPRSGKEMVSIEEMIHEFRLEDLTKAHAIFDEQKFRWMAGEYIRQAELNRLTELALPHLAAKQLVSQPMTPGERNRVQAALAVVRDHVACLSEAPWHLAPLLTNRVTFELEAQQIIAQVEAQRVLQGFLKQLEPAGELVNGDAYRQLAKAVEQETGAKGRALFQPLRLALTGRMHGPELVLIVPFLGKARCMDRIRAALHA